jgi:hypothetical protein
MNGFAPLEASSMGQASGLAAACFAIALLSACSGGGGAPATGGGPGGGGASDIAVAVKIDAAGASSSARMHANYLSPAMQSLTVAVNGRTPVAQTLTPSSSGCTVPTGGTLTCTVTVEAPPGSDTFAFVTYDGTAGSGHALSKNTATLAVSNTANTLDVTLSGVPQSILIAPLPGQTSVSGNQGQGFTVAGTSPVSFIVAALDASANVIVGPGSPTLTVASGSPALTVTSSSTSPNEFVLTPVTIGATASVSLTATGTGGAGTVTGSAAFTIALPLVAPPSGVPGKFFVYNEAGSGPNATIDVFAKGASGSAVPTQLTGSNTLLGSNGGNLTVAPDGTLYADGAVSPAAIVVFAPGATGNATPERTIADAQHGGYVAGTGAMTLDSAGNLYMVAGGTNPAIAKFPAGASGTTKPLVISGSLTGLSSYTTSTVYGVAVDAENNVYCVLASNGSAGILTSINVYAPSAFTTNGGNVAPARTISGSATGLITSSTGAATALAVGPDGTIYVSEFSSESAPATILAFASGANGNVPPLRTFSGPTILPNSQILVDANGYVYVSEHTFGPSTLLAAYSPTASGIPAPLFVLGNESDVVTDATGVALQP